MTHQDSGACAKDGIACPVCGGDVPPSLGYKPRKYCSPECRYAGGNGIYLRNLQPHRCEGCGVEVKYKGRGPRRGLKCERCKKEARKLRPSMSGRECKCERCGSSFTSRYIRRYCSRRCQYGGVGRKYGDQVSCKGCGAVFTKKRPTHEYCSMECSKTPAVYECLNCGVDFTRKRYQSGAVSCQKKYCTRECAFEARRLKKPCANRPLEVASKLARWFLSWGDDQWPAIAKCPDCGEDFTSQANAASKCRTSCYGCRQRITPICKNCIDCGVAIGPGLLRRCAECRETNRRKKRRQSKYAQRKKSGGEGSFRQRCKKYGAPYTNVSKKAVMDRDDWKCKLCGEGLLHSYTTISGTRTPHPLSPTIDHIIPLSFGPTSPGHVFDNCQAACWQCNCERGAEDADSFARRKATTQYY